jgi:hypothetical protein
MMTSAVPVVPVGVVAVISVSLTTVRPVAAAPPTVTAVAPVKPLPTIVTELPPAAVPDVGEMLEKTGAGITVVVATVVLSSADADEVIIPRTIMVRQKTKKTVLRFIHSPASDTFVSHCPE